jgi:hypothetical protein
MIIKKSPRNAKYIFKKGILESVKICRIYSGEIKRHHRVIVFKRSRILTNVQIAEKLIELVGVVYIVIV